MFACLALGAPAAVFADTTGTTAAADAAAVAARQAALQAELDQLNAAIADQQQILETRHSESASLQNDIAILNAQIQKDELSIQARDLTIQQLTAGIGDKNATIATLNDKLAKEQQSLADILRKTNSIDQTTLAELILSSDTVSKFFADLDSFDAIKSSLQQSFTDIASTKSSTTVAMTDLENQRAQEQELRQEQVIQENQVKANKSQQQTLLTASQARENATQAAITASQKVVAQIEAELFNLRDTAAIPFGKALAYTDKASQITGVPSAFILGILKQESDLGANVGACYVTNLSSGDGVGKNSGKYFQAVMKAPRDTVPFQTITGQLGLSWATTPVSCPPGQYYSARRGYGGAMGPSQFIPSTWQLYANRIANALGIAIPDPWNPEDAIMATALYLKDIGGASSSYTAERAAACRYYAGGSGCTSVSSFYGDSVMDNASYFQNQIDLIKGTS